MMTFSAGKVTLGLTESNDSLQATARGWLKSAVDWLPVQRDQLRVQRLVTCRVWKDFTLLHITLTKNVELNKKPWWWSINQSKCFLRVITQNYNVVNAKALERLPEKQYARWNWSPKQTMNHQYEHIRRKERNRRGNITYNYYLNHVDRTHLLSRNYCWMNVCIIGAVRGAAAYYEHITCQTCPVCHGLYRFTT